jgi:hypothetical protein
MGIIKSLLMKIGLISRPMIRPESWIIIDDSSTDGYKYVSYFGQIFGLEYSRKDSKFFTEEKARELVKELYQKTGHNYHTEPFYHPSNQIISAGMV